MNRKLNEGHIRAMNEGWTGVFSMGRELIIKFTVISAGLFPTLNVNEDLN